MAYRNLYTPLSQFVDPMSTEISQELRAKYLTSFQAQDQVAQALSELPVASFENDQRIYNDLYNSTRAEIDALASRGDYENMFVPVSRLARTYKNTATPLEANYNRYQADVQAKKEMLDKGEISMSDYEGWLRKSRLKQGTDDYVPYMGIELDENGRAIQSSYYGGTPIARFVDIQTEILDALNKVPEVKQGGYEVVEYETINGMQFAVTKKGQIVEFVPQEAVLAVTQNILQRPDVQAYMTQSADFATMELDEQALDAILRGQVQYLKGIDEDAGAAEVAKILNTGSVGTKRRAAKSIAYNKDASNYISTALATRQPSAYGGKYAISYDGALTNKLEERMGPGAGSYQPVLPGQDYVLTNPAIADEAGNVTPESILKNMAASQEKQAAGVEALLEHVPDLAEGLLQNNNLQGEDALNYVNEILEGPNGVQQLIDIAKNANPNADIATITANINQAKRQYDYFRAERELGQQMIQNSFGDFRETVVNNIVSDYATSKNTTVDQLADYANNFNSWLEADGAAFSVEEVDFVSGAPSRTLITIDYEGVQQGKSDRFVPGSQLSENIADLIFVKQLMQQTAEENEFSAANNSGDPEVFKLAGISTNAILSDIIQMTLGVDADQAKNLMDAADQTDIMHSRRPYEGRNVQYPKNEPLTQNAFELSRALTRGMRKAYKDSKEILEETATTSYSFGVSNTALGDNKKGTYSKGLIDAMKGYNLSNFAGVQTVGYRDAEGKIQQGGTVQEAFPDNMQYAEIKDVDFTQIATPRGIEGALVLNVGKVTGAPSGIELEASSVTIPYSAAVLDYFPEMEALITNATSPGAAIINNALGLALNHPGAWDENSGVTLYDNIAGRDIEITVMPIVQPVADSDIKVIAGVDRIIVTSSGAGVEDRVSIFNSQEAFVEEYNKIKATQIN